MDDETYSRHNVQLLLVGVPTGVREYFSKLPNLQTVVNRLFELPQVGRLNSIRVDMLVDKGFGDFLKVDIDSNHPDLLSEVKKHTFWVTDGIPQCVHEYCLELAYLTKQNKWLLQPDLVAVADRKWLRRALSKNYTIIDQLMNQRNTKVGRRNQVLYSLGRIAAESFRYSDVERVLRSEFPQSAENVKLDVAGVLSQIAASDNAPIRLTPKGESYQFVDPRFRMCLRVMLIKTIDIVLKVDLATLQLLPNV